CDLNSDWIVDVDDLELFIREWLWSACWRYDISAMQQQASAMMTQSGTLFSESLNTVSIDVRALKVESAESSETETSLTLSLINQIDCLINTDQENAEAWQEMKSLLEHSLLEIEKTRIKTAEF
nr:hypothetical protein [Anaerohalosphaeraceae bacterium]